MKKTICLIIIMGYILAGCSAIAERERRADVNKYLHVESPKWEDQIIYFLMTDRFYDGDPTNNNQGAGEYNRESNAGYSGGDIKGVTKKIEYIKQLGATAVWITPPVANQWWNDNVKYSGYHGYWAENFKKVDKHYGTLDDYKALSAELHKNNMYLIQDIVCNHTGDFFDYSGEYDSGNTMKNFIYHKGSKPSNRPSQYPFSLNNGADPKENSRNIYNWTPPVRDFQNEKELLTYQMSGLDDLNTANKEVRDTLKDSFNFWIREAGVDAYRIDTVIYVEHDFWNDFVHSKDKKYPGVKMYAEKYKKNDFFTFGETWVNVTPLKEDGDIKAASYTGTKEKPEMSSVLNFPLHIDLLRVFGEGKSTSLLAYRLENMFKYYREPYRLLNFIDNHDMARFISFAPTAAVRQGLMFIMTIPGIPVIYYGTEQNFTETRSSMFKEGFGSGGKEWFNTESDSFKFLQKLIELRKKNEVWRRGKLSILQDNKADTGVFAYKMELNGVTGIVIFNTSEEPALLDNLETGLAEGTELILQAGLLRYDKNMVVGRGGKLSSILQPRAGMVFVAGGKVSAKKIENEMTLEIQSMKGGESYSSNFAIEGVSKGITNIFAVVDGNIRSAVKCKIGADGRWSGTIPAEMMEAGEHRVTMYGYNNDKNLFAVSQGINFCVNIPAVIGAEYKDLIGDDKGRNGTYIYPSEKGFNKQMDIEKVVVYKVGKNLKIAVTMAEELSTLWNPKYGFDHVSFNIYFQVPGRDDGVKYMPLQNGDVPDGIKWNYMTLLGGWITSMYESKRSSPTAFGDAVTPAPKISTDKEAKTIEFTISGKALGNPEKLEGMKIYISTWDYDGMENRYRVIDKVPGPYTFGGSEPGSVYVIDETEIIEIK